MSVVVDSDRTHSTTSKDKLMRLVKLYISQTNNTGPKKQFI